MLRKCAAIYALMSQRAAEGHLPVARQALESVLLLLSRGVGPGYYQMAGFWRRELSWRDKAGQLSAREYRRVIERLNPELYRKLSQNKVAEKAILTLFGLPTPKFLGRLCAGVGLDADASRMRDAQDLRRVLRQHGGDAVVFKELEGYGGKGIRIVQLQPDGDDFVVRPIASERPMSLDAYVENDLRLGRGGDWLVEEWLQQHPTPSSLNPTSVNTVRMWVLRQTRGAHVLLAYLRIGRAGMYVDNATSGGIVAPIDLRSGVLGAARDASAARCLYRRHPDTQVLIEGLQLPCWEEVMELGLRVLAAFPELRFAGMDIAIGAKGPVIIEMNVSPDREGAAFTGFRSVELSAHAMRA